MTTPLKRLASFNVTLKNFILVTHAVPASRVRPLLPEGVALQTFDREGVSMGFVSTAVFFNHHFRWGLSRLPRMNFFQNTYRAYVTCRGLPGVFFFRNLMGTLPSFAFQKAICRDTRLAAFDLRRFSDETFDVKIRSADGMTHFLTGPAVSGAVNRANPGEWSPFEDDFAMTQFLTYRLFGFFRSPGGILMNQRVSHQPMTPLRARLEIARFEPWEHLGVLDRSSMAEVFSVLVQPEIEFNMLPPMPVHALSALSWQSLQPASGTD